jgi:hypothetical protein
MSVMKGNFLERSSYITVLGRERGEKERERGEGERERKRERVRVNNKYRNSFAKIDHLPKGKDIRPLTVRVEVTASVCYCGTRTEHSQNLRCQVVELSARNDNIALLTLKLRTTVERERKFNNDQHIQ